jgi:hypothetical protein
MRHHASDSGVAPRWLFFPACIHAGLNRAKSLQQITLGKLSEIAVKRTFIAQTTGESHSFRFLVTLALLP